MHSPNLGLCALANPSIKNRAGRRAQIGLLCSVPAVKLFWFVRRGVTVEPGDSMIRCSAVRQLPRASVH